MNIKNIKSKNNFSITKLEKRIAMLEKSLEILLKFSEKNTQGATINGNSNIGGFANSNSSSLASYIYSLISSDRNSIYKPQVFNPITPSNKASINGGINQLSMSSGQILADIASAITKSSRRNS